ncbi:low molecular weight phosphotyrosine protein phosphatase-like [Anticarsia gemmatalis]|uniref:low molecular weight phosphotyrosine protein phosphatase-like n=1 Tax=Anticarsia gemmatalis TaxID=129554 RepID=UPI003F766F4E
MEQDKKKILFVCYGNSCRSPIAEGVFRKTVNKMNIGDQWEIDSAALGDYHVGKPPTWRAMDTLKKHDVRYNGIARQIVIEDFYYFDYIFGMDEYNMSELNDLAPEGSKAKLSLFGEFDPQGERIIRDPYFDNHSKGFEKCYEQTVRCSKGFLDSLPK